MAELDPGTPRQTQSLVSALAEKGTPGLVLLGIVFLTVWGPITGPIVAIFTLIGEPKGYSELSLRASLIAPTAIVLIFLAYLVSASWITFRILASIVPTIRAEAGATSRLSREFGGRIVTSMGTMETLAVDARSATRRAQQIMRVLIERYEEVLELQRVRTNIFTLREDHWLQIEPEFQINMLDAPDFSIAIPNGLLSSGRAFKYSRPVLSIKRPDGTWPYEHDLNRADVAERLTTELAKVHPDLKWITSMPIPYQVKPFELVCGSLNVDGLEPIRLP